MKSNLVLNKQNWFLKIYCSTFFNSSKMSPLICNVGNVTVWSNRRGYFQHDGSNIFGGIDIKWISLPSVRCLFEKTRAVSHPGVLGFYLPLYQQDYSGNLTDQICFTDLNIYLMTTLKIFAILYLCVCGCQNS